MTLHEELLGRIETLEAQMKQVLQKLAADQGEPEDPVDDLGGTAPPSA